MMIHRILCPVDFSEASRRALQYAFAIARWHESEIAVVHVEDVLLHAATIEAGGHPDMVERQYQVLHDFIDEAGGTNRKVRVHIASGRVVPGILDRATRDASNLIVMGTNGRSGFARAVLGSVAEGVVRQAGIPVLTIPPTAEFREFELMPFDPILCASDFSPACRRALDLSIVMGQEADARLILLHALPSPRIDGSASRKEALARLRHGLPSDAVFRCRPEAIIVEGRPAEAIVQTAYRENVRLIVMGVQARGAVDRLLFGSTTRRVMQAAVCPVLSIRAGQDARSWPARPAAAQRKDECSNKVSAVGAGVRRQEFAGFLGGSTLHDENLEDLPGRTEPQWRLRWSHAFQNERFRFTPQVLRRSGSSNPFESFDC